MVQNLTIAFERLPFLILGQKIGPKNARIMEKWMPEVSTMKWNLRSLLCFVSSVMVTDNVMAFVYIVGPQNRKQELARE